MGKLAGWWASSAWASGMGGSWVLSGLTWVSVGEGVCASSSQGVWVCWAWSCVNRAGGALCSSGDQGDPFSTGKVPASKVGRWGDLQWVGVGATGHMDSSGASDTKQMGENKKGAFLCGMNKKCCLYLKMGVKGKISSTWESTEEPFVAHSGMRYDKLMFLVWSSSLM